MLTTMRVEPSRRSSELRQVELVDAALSIIAARGITALSTRNLAAEVGLSTGAIFRHFASLDALLDAVVARVESVLDSTYPSKELPPLERLERFVEARSAAVGGQLGILRLVLSDQFLMALPESGSARLSASVQRSWAFVRGCVRDGQRAGEFRADIDANALAVIAMGTIHMLALSRGSSRQRAAVNRAVRVGLATLLQPPTTSRSTSGRRTT